MKAIVRTFRCELPGEHEKYLAGRIHRHVRQWLQFTARRNVDNGPFSARLHVVDQHASHHRNGASVDVDHAPQQISGHLSQFLGIIVHSANVVDCQNKMHQTMNSMF